MTKAKQNNDAVDESKIVQQHYVSFGRTFVLHPSHFVLGVTLEWVRIPSTLVGNLVGRSSWGRRGLIIATATAVHPGFTGCLTLELTNVGEIPIEVRPGMTVCQLFLDRTSPSTADDRSAFVGFRRPVLGRIDLDDTTRRLMAPPNP